MHLIQECNALWDFLVVAAGPDEHIACPEFAVGDERSIRYGLGAVRGGGGGCGGEPRSSAELRGARAIQKASGICTYRRLRLCRRVNRRVLEATLSSSQGSLDCFAVNRATLMRHLGTAMQRGDQSARAHEAGQVDLFGLAARGGAPRLLRRGRADARRTLPDWSEAQRLAGVSAMTLGLYLENRPSRS